MAREEPGLFWETERSIDPSCPEARYGGASAAEFHRTSLFTPALEPSDGAPIAAAAYQPAHASQAGCGAAPFTARFLLLGAGLLLLATGVAKAMDIPAFQLVIETHALLPTWAVGGVAWLVPLCEIALGASALASVAFGRREPVVSIGLATLFLAFMVYAMMMDARPTREPSGCGCGLRAGPIEDWTPLAIQNGVSAAALAGTGLALMARAGTRGPT